MIFFRFLTYNKFRGRNWPHLSPNERLEAYQKLENIQAEKLHRPACEIVAKPMEESLRGQFSNQNNVIYLNEAYITDANLSYDGMATIFHEGRHAYQHYVCFEKEKVHRWSRAYKWRQNFAGYEQGSEEKYSFYSMQPVERDANRYALYRLKQFKRRYKNDPLYWATLEYREMLFNEERIQAKKDLGFFYWWKVKQNNKQNSEEY